MKVEEVQNETHSEHMQELGHHLLISSSLLSSYLTLEVQRDIRERKVVGEVKIMVVMSVAFSYCMTDRCAEEKVIHNCFPVTVEKYITWPLVMQEEDVMIRLQLLMASRRRSPFWLVGTLR